MPFITLRASRSTMRSGGSLDGSWTLTARDLGPGEGFGRRPGQGRGIVSTDRPGLTKIAVSS